MEDTINGVGLLDLGLRFPPFDVINVLFLTMTDLMFPLFVISLVLVVYCSPFFRPNFGFLTWLDDMMLLVCVTYYHLITCGRASFLVSL